jgi:hypothetical protein
LITGPELLSSGLASFVHPTPFMRTHRFVLQLITRVRRCSLVLTGAFGPACRPRSRRVGPKDALHTCAPDPRGPAPACSPAVGRHGPSGGPLPARRRRSSLVPCPCVLLCVSCLVFPCSHLPSSNTVSPHPPRACRLRRGRSGEWGANHPVKSYPCCRGAPTGRGREREPGGPRSMGMPHRALLQALKHAARLCL